MAEVQIMSMSHRHEAIADWLLAHPNEKNLEALSKHMNYSRSWLSVVIRSDVFQEYFARRRAEWEKQMLNDIGAQQLDVMSKAWSSLADIVQDKENTDPRLIFDVANKTAERLFGAKPKAVVTEERTQELVRPVDAGTLGQAREMLKRTVTTTREVPVEQLPAPV